MMCVKCKYFILFCLRPLFLFPLIHMTKATATITFYTKYINKNNIIFPAKRNNKCSLINGTENSSVKPTSVYIFEYIY